MGDTDQEFWDDAYKQEPDQAGVPDHFLGQEVADLEPGTAVDLGCGVGDNALMLAGRGWQVTGLDFATEAINLANQAAHDKGLKADFIAADTTTWQPPQQYDLVITTYALPGGQKSKQVLDTALKALAQGGTLIVIEWDDSMAAAWGFGEDDLISVEEIVANLPGLAIEKAEVREVDNPFQGEDAGQSLANVALVRARKPVQTPF